MALMNIFTQAASRYTQGVWRNRKSGKTRAGEWLYYWPGDKFIVRIKGLRVQEVHGEHPEYGDWRLVR